MEAKLGGIVPSTFTQKIPSWTRCSSTVGDPQQVDHSPMSLNRDLFGIEGLHKVFQEDVPLHMVSQVSGGLTRLRVKRDAAHGRLGERAFSVCPTSELSEGRSSMQRLVRCVLECQQKSRRSNGSV